MEVKGTLSKTKNFLKSVQEQDYRKILTKYGQRGVDALERATPKDSGKTAKSWRYEIEQQRNGVTLRWTNDNIVNGVPVVILLQYGHATKNGGYIKGRDFINPVVRPIFDQIADEVWKEVTRK